MKFNWLLFLFYTCICTNLNAQKEGDKWVIGYYDLGIPDYSVMHLDFSHADLQIEWHYQEAMNMDATCSNICNADGNAILWTNGMCIYREGGISIVDSISYSNGPDYWNHFDSEEFGPLGFPEYDGAIVLPLPGSGDEFMFIYYAPITHPTKLFETVGYLSTLIKYDSSSDYEIIYKDSAVGPRLESYTTTVEAVKHANGRDWWIIVFESDSPKYYAYVLDPGGIHLDHIGTIDREIKDGLGNTVFSKQGNFMARMDLLSITEGEVITLFSFDRCEGMLERIATINIPSYGYFAGVEFSPSEQYLYSDDNTHLWQWDLWSQDILASKTLVDTFDGFVQPGWFEMDFGTLVGAPDGRIYMIPPAGSSEYIHVIDRPDLPADQCRFRQHYINLTKPNGRSAPNIPNYRLGPLDDSTCDTLGLDNHPVSRWRYETDQPNQNEIIRFTDLSFYDPEHWHWDFGDGETSETPSPLHNFSPGYYHVCLTVSNQYDSDSTCQWVEILTTGINETSNSKDPDIKISPNPFHDQIIIQSRSTRFRNVQMTLRDVNGKIIFSQYDLLIPSKLYLPDFPSGIYFCSILDVDGTASNFNLIKK